MDALLRFIIYGIMLGIMAGFFLGYYLGRRDERKRDMIMRKWELTREKGQRNFILIKGVLLWGGLTGLFSFILTELMDPSPLWMLHLVMNMTLFPLGGILWGWLVWRSLEKKYRIWNIESLQRSDPIEL